jgi:hypothetical protein
VLNEIAAITIVSEETMHNPQLSESKIKKIINQRIYDHLLGLEKRKIGISAGVPPLKIHQQLLRR